MNQPASQPTHPIVGAWSLISFESQRDDGTSTQPFGAKPQGSIIYTLSGRFSAQVLRTDRPQCLNGDQMAATPAEMSANYKGCIAYYGSFELNTDAGFVIHRVEGSLFPNWQGGNQQRFFEFSGNTLKLSTPPMLWGGGRVVGVLAWDRIG